MVPEYVTETQTVTVTEMQQKTEQRTIKVVRNVPREETRTRTVTKSKRPKPKR